MAATPEGKIKRLVKAELSRATMIYQFWPVQTGMGARTLDCIGCHRGRFFAIETKREGEQLTEQQEWIRQKIQLAGGRVFVINSSDQDAQCWVDLLTWLLLE